MSFIKEIPVGSLGKIKIEEAAGKASIELSIEESVGGGQASGVAKLSAGAKAEVDAKHLIDLGFDLAASKFPSAAGLIQAAKLAVDAEISKA